MSVFEEKLEVLTRMAIPLIEICQKKGIRFIFGANETSFDFTIWEENNYRDYRANYTCDLVNERSTDWNVDDDYKNKKFYLHFRTYESMKAILWNIRMTLEDE